MNVCLCVCDSLSNFIVCFNFYALLAHRGFARPNVANLRQRDLSLVGGIFGQSGKSLNCVWRPVYGWVALKGNPPQWSEVSKWSCLKSVLFFSKIAISNMPAEKVILNHWFVWQINLSLFQVKIGQAKETCVMLNHLTISVHDEFISYKPIIKW